jgi:hypothetical protein
VAGAKRGLMLKVTPYFTVWLAVHLSACPSRFKRHGFLQLIDLNASLSQIDSGLTIRKALDIESEFFVRIHFL